MAVHVRRVELGDLRAMRDLYRHEMDCQVIHDSIHPRPGWSEEYLLAVDGRTAGYGSVAVAWPWEERRAVYEFYVLPHYRSRAFDLFGELLATTKPVMIETQSNAPMLCVMLHAFARDVASESILFHDRLTTHLPPPDGAMFRHPIADDKLDGVDLDQFETHGVIELGGAIAASGGILFHYNPPYGDIYMEVAAALRQRGIGAYLVQELKRVARERGNIPAARCNLNNVASRRTLQKAGFVPCGHILTGTLVTTTTRPDAGGGKPR